MTWEQTKRDILVVDDSPDQFTATERAFRKTGLPNPIVHCADGDSALDYLHCRGEFTDRDPELLPAVVLLDLNMPGTDGHQVLAEIKRSEHLKVIPVIVLTTSADYRDVQTSYARGANSYIVKPVEFSGPLVALDRLQEFWLHAVMLPTARSSS